MTKPVIHEQKFPVATCRKLEMYLLVWLPWSKISACSWTWPCTAVGRNCFSAVMVKVNPRKSGRTVGDVMNLEISLIKFHINTCASDYYLLCSDEVISVQTCADCLKTCIIRSGLLTFSVSWQCSALWSAMVIFCCCQFPCKQQWKV